MKTILLVLGLSLALSMSAFAQTNQAFKVLNSSGVTVAEVYASPTAKNMWGDNLIKNKVAGGETFEISVPVEAANCTWDIKYKDDQGKEYMLTNVDLCNTKTVTFAQPQQDQNKNVDMKKDDMKKDAMKKEK